MNICLVMVAKTDQQTLERCLKSVYPCIDSFLILVDPGDREVTQKAVDNVFPVMGSYKFGDIEETPWVNVAHNRTLAFKMALEKSFELMYGKPDYFLVLDADDYLLIDQSFDKYSLTADVYEFNIKDGSINYWRPQLFKADLHNLRYEGSFHECAMHNKVIVERLTNIEYVRVSAVLTESQQKAKYKKFIDGLSKEWKKDSSNPRTAFYLAQSFKDAGELKSAFNMYKHRARMSGWDEETWSAMYEAAKLEEKLYSEAIESYLECFNFRPQRIEPLYELARYYRTNKNYHLACLFAASGFRRPIPKDERLMLDTSIYNWRLMDEYAVASSWVPDGRTLSRMLHDQLLKRKDIPEADYLRIEGNRKGFDT